MIRTTLTALALLLAIPAGAAMPPQANTSAATSMQGSVTETTEEWFDRTRPAVFRAPRDYGGSLQAAFNIAAMANRFGSTMLVDRRIVSAGVFMAIYVDRIQITDPDAPWFGLHELTVQAEKREGASDVAYMQAGISNCLTWYRARPEARTNRPVYVSWNFLRGDCKGAE